MIYAQERSGADAALELVAQSDEPVGNIAFTPDGRMIFSHHPAFEPNVRVAERRSSDGRILPFPDAGWNAADGSAATRLDAVLGIRGDEQGTIWMLDMGTRSKIVPKLVAWSTTANRIERVYEIPAPASRSYSQPNDFAIDRKHGAVYIADEGIGPGGDGSKGALVVLDLKSGNARRVLEGHVSTRAEAIPIVVNGRPLTADGKPAYVGADGIVADHSLEWLYFGPLNGRSLYRVRIADLLDSALSDGELGNRVERYADKPNNGGLSIDGAGNIYLTEVGDAAVGIIRASDRKYTRLASRPDMSWPDGVSYGPDGYMYVSAAQVHQAAPFNGGKRRDRPPYLIFRFRPEAPGKLGH